MATIHHVLTTRDRTVLAELEGLVRETYQLWDENWVGFSWRNYTYDHVMRVRNLARSISSYENGDIRVLEFAATLHDVTKSYDGEIMMRDGKRVVDADGFWLNEKLPPARQNRVTALYESLGLSETVHHYSGAQVATTLLREYGYEEDFCAAVREIILAHLKPQPKSSPAALSMYDADTIDANIGMPAFYRNVRITMHRLEQEYSRRGENIDDYLTESLDAFLNSYLREKIPAWIDGKRNDFISRLTTETGKQVARERCDRLAEEVAAMIEELEELERHLHRGRLAVVKRFVENRDNPSLAEEVAYLTERWPKEVQVTSGARQLVGHYQDEIAGVK